jgi:hypothetical protein
LPTAQLLTAKANVMAKTAKMFRGIQVLVCVRRLCAFEARFRTVTVFMTIIFPRESDCDRNAVCVAISFKRNSSLVDVALL